MPDRLQNAWTVVAVAMVASTLLKGIFDYLGTYLVNYAGYGLITRPPRRFVQPHTATLGCVLS